MVLLLALDLAVIPKTQNLLTIEGFKEIPTMAKGKDSTRDLADIPIPKAQDLLTNEGLEETQTNKEESTLSKKERISMLRVTLIL